MLAQMLRIPTIQPTNHMELKKKKDQSVDAAVLHRWGEHHNHRREKEAKPNNRGTGSGI